MLTAISRSVAAAARTIGLHVVILLFGVHILDALAPAIVGTICPDRFLSGLLGRIERAGARHSTSVRTNLGCCGRARRVSCGKCAEAF